MDKRSIFLCLLTCFSVTIAQSQTMNIQTQSGITSINISDIVNITFTDQDDEMVTDIDDNTYKTVKIGDQVWMAENLKVTRYRNGDAIPHVKDNATWAGLTTGAYCNYDNIEANASTYGRLYNWYAVNDSRNIAPAGWHVPTDAEWQTLVDYLGGGSVAGGKMKEAGTSHWYRPNTGANNLSGFTALPGGLRNKYGDYYFFGDTAQFWSSTEHSSNAAWNCYLSNSPAIITRANVDKHHGFSVRCVRDN